MANSLAQGRWKRPQRGDITVTCVATQSRFIGSTPAYDELMHDYDGEEDAGYVAATVITLMACVGAGLYFPRHRPGRRGQGVMAGSALETAAIKAVEIAMEAGVKMSMACTRGGPFHRGADEPTHNAAREAARHQRRSARVSRGSASSGPSNSPRCPGAGLRLPAGSTASIPANPQPISPKSSPSTRGLSQPPTPGAESVRSAPGRSGVASVIDSPTLSEPAPTTWALLNEGDDDAVTGKEVEAARRAEARRVAKIAREKQKREAAIVALEREEELERQACPDLHDDSRALPRSSSLVLSLLQYRRDRRVERRQRRRQSSLPKNRGSALMPRRPRYARRSYLIYAPSSAPRVALMRRVALALRRSRRTRQPRRRRSKSTRMTAAVLSRSSPLWTR